MSEPTCAPDALAARPCAPEPSRPRGALARFLGIIEERVILNLATVLMLGAMALMFYEASSRTLLSESHWWAEESVRFLVVWSVMLSLGIATRKGNYVRMDLFIDSMPRPVRRVAAWIGCLAGIVFSVMVVIAGTLGVMHLHRVGMQTESNLDLPLWIVRLALPIGAALYGTYFVTVAFDLLRGREEVQPVAN